MEVLVIGAGTTGLLLAHGLKQAGIKATICEGDAGERYKNRPREWGMTLHWGSDAIAKVLPLELRDRIREACCDPLYGPAPADAELVHYDGQTGEPPFWTPAATAMSVSRSKMRRLFSEGLDIQYGKRLRSIERTACGVTAHFEDGERLDAGLIVGCDGSRSVVREMLVGTEAAQVTAMDINMLNFPANFDADTARLIRAQHPVFFNSVHPKGLFYWLRILDVPDPSDAASWSFQNIFSWRGAPGPAELDTQEKRTAWLKSRAVDYAEPWRTVLQRMPADVKFGIDPVTIWSPPAGGWSDSALAGTVTLAGDAAHSIPAYRGQGLQNGLEDAAQLTERLGKTEATAEGWQKAVAAYEQELVPRAVRDVEIGRVTALIFHDYEKVLKSPMAKLGIRRSRPEDVKRQEDENGLSDGTTINRSDGVALAVEPTELAAYGVELVHRFG
ncbi:hypothetical protein LTR53_001712 [Teratosphaeriaceae sp. CCFEE 6253]|nr:hypothetical protein LTR53_001712 [Teratosphaeriaceae sp. CCFEE 6253]